MRQKGFATIFSLCMILVIAIVVKGIQEAETYNAREVLNFYLEQQLQNAAESAIYVAVEKIKDGSADLTKKPFLNYTKNIQHGEEMIDILLEVWGEQSEILDGVYLMSRASCKSKFFHSNAPNGKNYRRAYAYILKNNDDKAVHFMESP